MKRSLEKQMQRNGLLSSTAGKYTAIIKSAVDAGAGGHEIVRWLNARLRGRVPIGTVLPMRAAVRQYLISELGYTEGEVQDALPDAKGVPASTRGSLSVDQLGVYYMAVEQFVPEPSKTVLLLLPLTGLTISEATSLRKDQIKRQGSGWQLVVKGRHVPLNGAAVQALEAYFDAYAPEGPWLFPTHTLRPVGPHAVRKYTRKMAASFPDDLPSLSPHVLRRTAAHLWFKQGKNLKAVQLLLGHKNVATTALYLNGRE